MFVVDLQACESTVEQWRYGGGGDICRIDEYEAFVSPRRESAQIKVSISPCVDT